MELHQEGSAPEACATGLFFENTGRKVKFLVLNCNTLFYSHLHCIHYAPILIKISSVKKKKICFPLKGGF